MSFSSEIPNLLISKFRLNSYDSLTGLPVICSGESSGQRTFWQTPSIPPRLFFQYLNTFFVRKLLLFFGYHFDPFSSLYYTTHKKRKQSFPTAFSFLHKAYFFILTGTNQPPQPNVLSLSPS